MVEPVENLETAISEFATSLRYEALPADILADAKYRLLDWIGCALAGVQTSAARIAIESVRETGGHSQATIVKESVRSSALQTAWANGIIGHIVEFDDGHRQAIAHPGAVAVPTALATAEWLGRSGQELITAIIAGYEVLIRLGIAVTPSHYAVWHTTATCGTFAAASTAASLLKLNPQQAGMALGIAGTMAAGLQETFGTHAKPLNVGHACQSGLQAAILAGKGFTGPESILAGKKGFMAATSTDRNTGLLQQLGQQQFLANTAFYKMYSSCGHTHSPLDAIFAILFGHRFSPSEIESIHIETYQTAVTITGQLKTASEEEAKFSLPYCIACALLYQRVTLAEFTQEKRDDPAVLTLAKKVQVVEDQEATQAFPKRHATVKVILRNGRQLEKRVTAADDTPRYAHIEEKFLSLAEASVSHADAVEIKNTVLKIDEFLTIQPLMEMLR